jgi:DNA-binding transcriptional MerR regulator
VRIGELAGLAGISTRAIRHYHRIGLLAEPARKANGYREYSLRDAVELARVRRLTELGLSLDEVGDVLADDAGRDLAEIVRELDADLARQEEDIRQRRLRLAGLLRQAEPSGTLGGQAPVSAGLAALFDRLADVAAATPGPEPAMAARDREILALLETAARGTGWLGELTGVLSSDPGAAEQAYAVYARLDELAALPVDDPRVEETARALAAAMPETARKAIRFPPGEFEAGAGGFAAAFYAEFAPAQAAAIRRAIDLMRTA